MKLRSFVAPILYILVCILLHSIFFIILNSSFLAYKQEAVWSWFPPLSASVVVTNGLDWTERCEILFRKILYDIRRNKLAPKSPQG